MASLLLAFAFVPSGFAASGDGTSIQFLHYWTGSLSGGIDNLAQSYNRSNPQIPVSVKGMEHESFKGAILALLAGGGAPDIFSYWAGARVGALVDAGKLENIEDVWRDNGLDGLFTPGIAAACTYGGLKYAIPVTQHYVAFFYNKRVFANLGLAVPRTWDEFQSVCSALSKAGVVPLALGSKERWPAQFWFDYILLRTAGPEYRSRLMSGQASYEDPEVVRAFAMWRDLIHKAYFNPSSQNLDWAGAAGLVREGRAAMTLMGTWIIGHYEGQLQWKAESDFDFFSFPVVDPSVPHIALGPIDVLVLTKGAGGEAAKRALAFFAGVKPQEAMSTGSGALAPNIRVPLEFYGGLKRRILQDTYKASGWAFNYDLATPPEVADIGLGCFTAFMRNPNLMDRILASTQRKAQDAFKRAGAVR
ncbi:MAG: ABC transporter substrate-binding protein [Thermodesulfobacteriota bacterium]